MKRWRRLRAVADVLYGVFLGTLTAIGVLLLGIGILTVAGWFFCGCATGNTGLDAETVDVTGVAVTGGDTSMDTTHTVSVEAGRDVTYVDLTGYAGWALVVPCLMLARAKRLGDKALARVIFGVEKFPTHREVKAYVRTAGHTPTGKPDKAEKVIRKTLDRIKKLDANVT